MDDEPSPEQLVEVRAHLDAVAAELRTLLGDEAGLAGTVVLDQAAMGRVSRVDALQAQQMAKAAHRRAGMRLKRVVAAISRFDAAFDPAMACCDSMTLLGPSHCPGTSDSRLSGRWVCVFSEFDRAMACCAAFAAPDNLLGPEISDIRFVS